MEKELIFVMTFTAVAIISLLGSNITGMVVSQSCCFPPNCNEEYLCEGIDAQSKYPDMITIYSAMVLVSFFVILFTILRR